MEKEFYPIILLPIIPILVMVCIYLTLIHEYKHESVVSLKTYIEPKQMLDRYKQSDLELTYDEASSLRSTYPDDIYVSEAEYYFMVDCVEISVNPQIFDRYNEGDSITYYKSVLSSYPTIKK